MTNDDIRSLIERLESKASVFVAKDCKEAAKALSLLLDEHEAGHYISRHSSDESWERWVNACRAVERR